MIYCVRFIASTRRANLNNVMTNFIVVSRITSCLLCRICLFRLHYLFCSKSQRFV